MNKLVQHLKTMKHPYGMFTHSDISTDLRALKKHFDDLPTDEYLQKKFNLSKVMRKRRMMQYNVEYDDQGKLTQLQENYTLKEYDETKQLQYAKIYQEITPEMKIDQNFISFLRNTLQLTWELKNFKKASLSVHAVRTISYENQEAQPTPEGPHQDGVDFEVIAIVNKFNCLGAESYIYSPDKKNLLFEMTLDPGEGYIIDGLNLWNYATPHKPVDPTKEGIRDIVGYLLRIKE